MTVHELLDQLGLRLSVVVAGTLGAIATLGMIPKEVGVSGRIVIVVGGAACANYFGPAIAEYFTLGENVAGATSFIVGGAGMNVLGGLFKLSQRFRDRPTLDIERLRHLGEDE